MINIEALNRYFRVIKRKKLASSTIRTYLDAAKKVNKRLLFGEEISQDFYEGLVESVNENCKNITAANNYINVINHWIDYLDYKNIPHNLKKLACQGIAITPVTNDKVLTPQEMEAICSVSPYYSGNMEVNIHLNLVYSTIFMFICQTGCRNDEARQLVVSSLNIEKREVWFFHKGELHTKGKRSRVAFLESPILLERLTSLIRGKSGNKLVFTSSCGGKITQSNLSKDLKRRAALAGIEKEVWPHLLRHSYSADLAENDVPIEHLTELLGHSDIRTTKMQYGHYNSSKLKASNRRQTNVKKVLSPEYEVEQDMELIKKLSMFNDDRFKNKEKILAKLRLEMLNAIIVRWYQDSDCASSSDHQPRS